MVLGTTGGLPAGQDYWDELGIPEPRTSISFPELRYPGPGKGGEEGCVFVGVLRDLGILMKRLSHYSKSVKFLNK